MSELDEIRLYCEDEERRPTVRLLFLALDALKREPWPLSRHAIESYLLDPPFLTQALPSRTEVQWKALLDHMAEARRWTDLLRATLVDLRWRVSRVEWTGTDAHLTSKDEALAELSSRFAKTKADIETALREPDARTKLESLEKDFAADGPLVHRVDGKRLLKALDEHLVREGTRRAGGLLEALLTHAERHGCPQVLLDDLRPLLIEVDAIHATWR